MDRPRSGAGEAVLFGAAGDGGLLCAIARGVPRDRRRGRRRPRCPRVRLVDWIAGQARTRARYSGPCLHRRAGLTTVSTRMIDVVVKAPVRPLLIQRKDAR